jgi:hypothetical protein
MLVLIEMINNRTAKSLERVAARSTFLLRGGTVDGSRAISSVTRLVEVGLFGSPRIHVEGATVVQATALSLVVIKAALLALAHVIEAAEHCCLGEFLVDVLEAGHGAVGKGCDVVKLAVFVKWNSYQTTLPSPSEGLLFGANATTPLRLNKNYSIIYYHFFAFALLFLVASISLFFIAMYFAFVLSQCFVHLPSITFLLLHPG